MDIDRCFSNTYLEPLRHIASGGMGDIYLAKDTRLDREVAVKVLKRQHDNGDDKEFDKMLSEARLMARVNHPNIVQLYDIIETDDGVLLVMEYVKGRTLAQYLKESLISFNDKIELLRQVAIAIHYSHQQSIVHSDIKAGNILITEQKAVKIIDFGIASLFSQKRLNGAEEARSYGSYGAMSPEQIRGEQLTQASDVFSFGILAYRFIYLKHPFGAVKGPELADAILNNKALPAHKIEGDVSEQCRDLINDMLMKAPQDRPQNMQHVLCVLENVLQQLEQDLSEETQPLGANLPDKRANSIRPLRWGVIITSILLLCVVYPFSLVLENHERIRYVIVLEPEIETEQGVNEHSRLTKLAIDNVVRQTVINSDKFELIAHSEYESEGIRLPDLVKVTGADIVLLPEARCEGKYCDVRLSFLNSDKLVVEKQLSGSVQSNDYVAMDTIFRSLAAHVLGNDVREEMSQSNVDPIAYQRFISLYDEVSFNGRYTVENFNKAVNLLEQNPNLFSLYSLLRELGLELYHASSDKNILTRLNRLFQYAPSSYRNSKAYTVDIAYIAIESGDYQFADELIAKLSSYGESALSFHLKGNLAYQQHKLPQAIAHYQKALQQNPSLISGYNLAIALYDHSQIQAAQQQFESLISRYPWYLESHRLLADIYMLDGNISGAIELYEMIGFENMSAIDHNNLALGFLVIGDTQKALNHAGKAVAMSPENTAFLLNLADINQLLNNSDSANDNYAKVIALNSGKEELTKYLESGQAYAQLGHHKKALEALYSGIKLSTDSISYSYSAALIYTLSGEIKSGLLHFKDSKAGGYTAQWFNLPWFIPLCVYEEFRKPLLELEKANICQSKPR
ncbi:hypothetical protein A7985_00385 [Pseudoalteromonas luteoviolacea]|uniref:Protein kinase domain-containing protein n=1 Tax=Pseudoalteromonas luteoviolacea TaxID=43657 RepID=A0A1C0TT08_9GAMM|nr:serine/threonine-protein kinase [Pseudoalteromonas luteoviolacea]OCQ22461.1 hypothetical protein A7985_00385 [Pseudoalteromonas luteoviolacea]